MATAQTLRILQTCDSTFLKCFVGTVLKSVLSVVSGVKWTLRILCSANTKNPIKDLVWLTNNFSSVGMNSLELFDWEKNSLLTYGSMKL